jgi:hypothetical protein
MRLPAIPQCLGTFRVGKDRRCPSRVSGYRHMSNRLIRQGRSTVTGKISLSAVVEPEAPIPHCQACLLCNLCPIDRFTEQSESRSKPIACLGANQDFYGSPSMGARGWAFWAAKAAYQVCSHNWPWRKLLVERDMLTDSAVVSRHNC